MHVLIDPERGVEWQTYYLSQAKQTGHGAAFEGYPYQRGHGLGNIFKSLLRLVLPVAKSAAGKAIGREALVTGTNIASDILSGQNVKTAVSTRSRQGAKRLVRKAKTKLQQGKGKRRRTTKKRKTAKRKTIKGRKRKTTTKRKRRKRVKRDALGIIKYG